MTAHSLYPNFVQITYAVNGFPHVMTHQLKNYALPSEAHPYGETTDWADDVDEADADVETFIEVIAATYPTVANFSGIFFYDMTTPTSQPVLVAAKTVNVLGTDADGNGGGDEYVNVQKTYSFLTNEGTKFRVQLMDVWARGEWARTTSQSGLSDEEGAIIDYILSDSNIFAARSDARPTVWRSVTATFNEKLRKARRYG